MFGILLRKQLYEVFRSWFYRPKTGKARTKKGTVGMVLLFLLLTVVLLGGGFTALAIGLAEPFCAAGAGYLYFVLFGLISIVLGLLGSVVNTYAALYRSKDNDLLLSMPIPAGTVVLARLFTTYLMGALYASLAFVPASAVYLVVGRFHLNVLMGNAVMLFEISLLVWILSCLLGFLVAKVSLKLKNRSIVAVLAAVAVMVLYYAVYFKAQMIISHMIAHAAQYGEKVRDSARVLYVWGLNGTGDLFSMLLCLAVCAALAGLTWLLLSKTFLNIATAAVPKKRTAFAARKQEKVHRVATALLKREFSRFTASANYMLNCGLGILFIPAAGMMLLLKGNEIFSELQAYPAPFTVGIPVGIAALSAMLASLNDMAVPSVSLEGKSLWIIQALPVEPWQLLKAKITAQLLLTEIPMLSLCLCVALLPLSVPDKLLCSLVALLCPVLFALFHTSIGLKMPMLEWSNEIVPIKQSGAVAIALFGSWGYALLLVGAYAGLVLWLGTVSAALYLAAFALLTSAACVFLYRWLKIRGAEILQTL